MSFSARDLSQLQSAVEPFDAANPHYVRFFREALGAAHDRGEPLDALEMLAALRQSPELTRDFEQEALAAALAWTTQRLRQEPGVAVIRFCAELGWIVRMLRVRRPPAWAREAERRPRPVRSDDAPRGGPRSAGAGPGGGARSAGGRPSAPPARGASGSGGRGGPPGRGGAGGRPTAAPALSVERMIEQLREARGRALGSAAARAAAPIAASSAAPAGPAAGRASGAAAAPAPTLPRELAAEFANVHEARQLRRAWRKREREGKPPKETFVALRAADAALRGARLIASSTRSDGLESVFDAMEARAGQTVRFQVLAHEARPDGSHLALRVRISD
jgi:hypothetical protein